MTALAKRLTSKLSKLSSGTRGIAYNVPTSPHQLPRFGGIATMMRLPLQQGDAKGLDACFVGIPMDQGTSWRSGTRHGPRMIRNESNMMNQFHYSTGAAPFESLQVADIGDVPVNPYNVVKTIDNIKEFYGNILKENCIPLALGGDHTLTLGTLRAMGEKYGPVAMIQVDAHSDTQDTMFGEKIAHGTPFRRAVEDGVLDPKMSFQIGLRAYGYSPSDFKWSKEQGFHTTFAKDCYHKSLVPLMDSIRDSIGPERPVYLTFDIDGIDPAYCPGTGTPEIGGLTIIQALEIVRGCCGLNIVGADLVEVNPLFDKSGTTAMTGANLLFEMLCILPGVKYYKDWNL
ncbi:PREDICTED: uncharacterized protein LOC100635301 [Amphimedon queenslandica]|uniref:Agmatinase n=1 Tax=Amphimedon queenslandica TaxID=400682 RepID=A0A1X7VFH0_AMPQE|nr:PREDICTED: uncharacterized protein LOC100635301 [Amphimedon queenslandica]|eukprot:XP_003384432.1 PREDICTED: uncharacterized protein LOC100635301 [Amphimedon queenslandica]